MLQFWVSHAIKCDANSAHASSYSDDLTKAFFWVHLIIPRNTSLPMRYLCIRTLSLHIWFYFWKLIPIHRWPFTKYQCRYCISWSIRIYSWYLHVAISVLFLKVILKGLLQGVPILRTMKLYKEKKKEAIQEDFKKGHGSMYIIKKLCMNMKKTFSPK